MEDGYINYIKYAITYLKLL